MGIWKFKVMRIWKSGFVSANLSNNQNTNCKQDSYHIPVNVVITLQVITNYLSENTVVDTHHSMAFFKPLGILKTYSGVQIKILSAFSISF